MFYEFQLGHSIMEASQNICVKGESTVDHNSVTRLFKKLCLGCKNFNDQTKSDRPEIMLQAIKIHLGSSTGSLAFHSPEWVITFTT